MANLNVSESSNEGQKLPLPPSMFEVESILASSNAIDQIVKKASLDIYRKYLDSCIPSMLTNWYMNSYYRLFEVIIISTNSCHIWHMILEML